MISRRRPGCLQIGKLSKRICSKADKWYRNSSHGTSIFNATEILDSQGQFRCPVIIQYCNLEFQERQLQKILNTKNKCLGGIVEMFILVKVNGMEESISTVGYFQEWFVLIKQEGSFNGRNCPEKIEAAYSLLVEEVSFSYCNCIGKRDSVF